MSLKSTKRDADGIGITFSKGRFLDYKSAIQVLVPLFQMLTASNDVLVLSFVAEYKVSKDIFTFKYFLVCEIKFFIFRWIFTNCKI